MGASSNIAEKEPRAFVLEPTDHSTEKASKFGAVVYLYDDPRQHPHPKFGDFQSCVVRALEAAGFDSKKDYLVMTGRITSLIAMTAAVVARWGSVNALWFDGRDDVREYEAVTLGS
jgi:hypothetical protein